MKLPIVSKKNCRYLLVPVHWYIIYVVPIGTVINAGTKMPSNDLWTLSKIGVTFYQEILVTIENMVSIKWLTCDTLCVFEAFDVQKNVY